MDIHLHHATTYAANAIGELSGAAMWSGDAAPSLQDQCIRSARDYLAKAAAQLNAYDAKRSFKPEAA